MDPPPADGDSSEFQKMVIRQMLKGAPDGKRLLKDKQSILCGLIALRRFRDELLSMSGMYSSIGLDLDVLAPPRLPNTLGRDDLAYLGLLADKSPPAVARWIDEIEQATLEHVSSDTPSPRRHLAATQSLSSRPPGSAVRSDRSAALQPNRVSQPDRNIKVKGGLFPRDRRGYECHICVVQGYKSGSKSGWRKILHTHIKNKHLKNGKSKDDKSKEDKFRHLMRSKCAGCAASQEDDSWADHIILAHTNYDQLATAPLSKSQSSSGFEGSSTQGPSFSQHPGGTSYQGIPGSTRTTSISSTSPGYRRSPGGSSPEEGVSGSLDASFNGNVPTPASQPGLLTEQAYLPHTSTPSILPITLPNGQRLFAAHMFDSILHDHRRNQIFFTPTPDGHVVFARDRVGNYLYDQYGSSIFITTHGQPVYAMDKHGNVQYNDHGCQILNAPYLNQGGG